MKMKLTWYQWVLEAIGVLMVLGLFLFLLLSWSSLPDRIPTHFNGAGEIDSWGGKMNLLLLPMVGLGSYLLLTVLSRFPKSWNIPVRVTPRNARYVYPLTRTLLTLMKVEMFATFGALTVFSAQASPLPGWFMPVFMGVLFGTIGILLAATIIVGRRHA